MRRITNSTTELTKLNSHPSFLDFNLFSMSSFLLANAHTQTYTHRHIHTCKHAYNTKFWLRLFLCDIFPSFPLSFFFYICIYSLCVSFSLSLCITNIYSVLLFPRQYGKYWGHTNDPSCQRVQHPFGKTVGWGDNYNVIQKVGNTDMKSYEWFSVVEQGRHLLYFGEMLMMNLEAEW